MLIFLKCLVEFTSEPSDLGLFFVERFFFFNKFIYLFIFIFGCIGSSLGLHWVFVAVRGLSLVAVSGGYSSLWCTGFSLQWLLLLRSMGSRCMGFSSCGTWAQ